MAPDSPASADLNVLLVDDDPGDAFLVREWLAEVAPQVTVQVRRSICDAIHTGALATADCVLLDLNLPGYRGLDGLREILRAGPEAAVCVLTGVDDEELGAAAVAMGAQDYLVKTKADGEVLIRALRYAVERRRAEISALRLKEEQLAARESARMERGLLPKPLLAGATVKAHSFYRPGRARSVIGGDFFDAVRSPSGAVHAIVGDVSGHGPDEAALGALLRVSWRALVLAGVDDTELLPKLQQVLVSERHDPRMFTTVCTVVIHIRDDETGRVGDEAIVRLAGHPAPVSLGAAPATTAAPIGPPLGVLREAHWPAYRVTLHRPWSLLLYTDGLIEGRGLHDGEPLWEEGLLELLQEEQFTDPTRLPAQLVERIQRLNGGPHVDDVAILLLSMDAETADASRPLTSASG